MELTKEIIDEVVLAAQEVEFGSVSISISGSPNRKLVDIVTEKRVRFRESIPTEPGVVKYERDKY